jgi:hypothetical protein
MPPRLDTLRWITKLAGWQRLRPGQPHALSFVG